MSTITQVQVENTKSRATATSWLIVPISLLTGLGMVMVYSASIRTWPTNQEQVFLTKHVSFLVISISLGFLASQLTAAFYQRMALPLYALTCVLLCCVQIPGIGANINGAQRWLMVGGYSFQPSEMAKLTLPLMLASLLVKTSGSIRLFSSINLKISVCLALLLGLVGIQPDLGTAIFLLMSAAFTLFIAGWPTRYFLWGALFIIPAIGYTLFVNPYQLERIKGLFATYQDFDSAPYQIRQSLMTMFSGEWFGQGLGKGTLKLSYLPEANNDFIFSVVGEELGLAGALSIIGLWLFFLWAGWLHISRNLNLVDCPQSLFFRQCVAYVLLLEIGLQALINIAVVTASAPTKGISHPFLSYGGSSLLISMLMIGVFYSLTKTDHHQETLEGYT